MRKEDLINLIAKVVVSAEVPRADAADCSSKAKFACASEADEQLSDHERYGHDVYVHVRDDRRFSGLEGIAQLDKTLIDKYIFNIKASKTNVVDLTDNEILELMGILKDGIPTLAGVLCFSKYPQATFPQLCITAVVIPGTQMGETNADGERFLANKRIEGPIGQMLHEAVLFVKKNMRENGNSNYNTEYPIKAVREAILNALMHRDYSISTEGIPIRIIMYTDRIEIINESGLYGKVTIDSLGEVHAYTRNQTLANILEIQNIAENRYSGISTIRMEMQKYNLPEPVFESKQGSFVLTFKNKREETQNDYETVTNYADGDLLSYCKTPRTREEIAIFLGLTQYYAMKTIVNTFIENGELKLTIPHKPKSKNQMYYS